MMTDPLYAEAMLGKDAEEFWQSDIGRYILGRIEEEEKEAVEILVKVSPWRRRRIMELQSRISRAQSIKGWFSELIISGRQALEQLEDQ